MKKIFYYFLPLVIACFTFASCSSDDDEPKQVTDIDAATVKAYQNGEVTRGFQLNRFKVQSRKDPDSKWGKLKDGLAYLLYQYPNVRIIFTKGQVWTALTSDARNYDSVKETVMNVYDAYLKFNDKKPDIFIAVPFKIDSNNVMNIGGEDFKVIEMTNGALVLDDYIPTVDNTQCDRFIRFYDIYYPQEQLDLCKTFDCERDALLYIVKIAREQFGNKIDLNNLTGTGTPLVENIIDLDKLEQMIYDEYGD